MTTTTTPEQSDISKKIEGAFIPDVTFSWDSKMCIYLLTAGNVAGEAAIKGIKKGIKTSQGIMVTDSELDEWIKIMGKLGLCCQVKIRRMPVNRENAMTAREFFHTSKANKRGDRIKVRRNGKTQTWKTRPDEFKIPVKYGLRECFYITHLNCGEWTID